jgi:twitching motility two-component system response regulator PilH
MARILIVDDEESITRCLSYFFRDAGHTPMTAATGHAALLAARTNPDLIFLDLGLPDISGDEVLRRLKREPSTAQIPVVIVSGEPDAAEIVGRSGATGAVAIMQKPVLASELCAMVDIVLEGRKAGAEGAPGTTPAGSGPLPHRHLLYRLISTGSSPLVRQVCRRLGADHTRMTWSRVTGTVSWAEIVGRARQEGVLGEAEGRALLQEVPRSPVEQTA